MATADVAPTQNIVHSPREAAVDAVRAAWVWWGTLLATPVVALAIGQLFFAGGATSAQRTFSFSIAVAATAWLLLVGGGLFVLRSHVFRAAWQGRAVSPRRYLRGVLGVWLAIEFAALAGVVSCLSGGALLPGGVPMALSLALLALLPPSGRAVAR